jgi:plastocyanin
MRQLFAGLLIFVSVAISVGCGGTSGGGGQAPDGGQAAGINGCTSADYKDATAAGASRTIAFGGPLANKYDPKCLLIGVGQSVTFSPSTGSSFGGHPLRPGASPSQPGNETPGPNSPIPSVSSGSSAAVVTFLNAGIYPYYCSAHDTLGMFGAVRVQ